MCEYSNFCNYFLWDCHGSFTLNVQETGWALIRDMLTFSKIGTDALCEEWESLSVVSCTCCGSDRTSDESRWRFINQPEPLICLRLRSFMCILASWRIRCNEIFFTFFLLGDLLLTGSLNPTSQLKRFGAFIRQVCLKVPLTSLTWKLIRLPVLPMYEGVWRQLVMQRVAHHSLS